MKSTIASVFGRTIAYVAVLAFVFGIVYISNNFKFLWLLCILPTVAFIPQYEITPVAKRNDGEKNARN